MVFEMRHEISIPVLRSSLQLLTSGSSIMAINRNSSSRGFMYLRLWIIVAAARVDAPRLEIDALELVPTSFPEFPPVGVVSCIER